MPKPGTIPSINPTGNSISSRKELGVEFKHPEYDAKLDDWMEIDDVLAGEKAVKAKKTTYLPKNNPDDGSDANNARYNNFLARAVFYAFTRRTWESIVGAVFKQPPMADLPPDLEYIQEDIDGAGVSIYQQSRKMYAQVFAKGRGGLLADFPQVDSTISLFDQEQGFARAAVIPYSESQIINWDTVKIGGKHVLAMVVLHEMEKVRSDDGFSFEESDVYRVLRLGGVIEVDSENAMVDRFGEARTMGYYQEIWRRDKDGKGEFRLDDEIVPRDHNGNIWDEIPFAFIGSENNDPSVDESPLHPMALLNLAHYRDSASYQNSVFWSGEPQLVITGLNQAWVDENLDGLTVGGGAAMPLPEGSDAKFIQPEANSQVKEAMDDKFEKAGMMGARFLDKGSAVKTATQAQGESESETSTAALVAGNVSEAYEKAIGWLQRFNTGSEQEFKFELNQEYINRDIDPNVVSALLQGVLQGKIPESDFWQYLKDHGAIDEEKTDDQIKDELETQGGQMDLDLDEDDGSE